MPAAFPSGAGLPAERGDDPLDPILAAARRRGFRAFRILGAVIGVAAAASLAPELIGGESPPGFYLAGVMGLLGGIAPWLIPASRERVAAAFMLGTMAVLAPVGLWTVGPSLGMGSLLVVVPLAASFLFGRTMAIVGAAYSALVLAGIGGAAALAGRSGVGLMPGGLVPYSVYLRIALTTLGCAGITLVLADAALGAVEGAIREARAAAERERSEAERRREAERSLARAQRLEAIGRLASGVAHDTRNALTVMRSAVGELRQAGLPAEQAEVVSDLEHAVAGVADTMRQLLALSCQGGAPPAAPRPVAPGTVVEAFASAVRRVLPEEVRLEVETARTQPVLLQPALLEQALLNLALNARDAMPEGGALSLRVREEPLESPGRVVVEVSDTGVGMDPAVAARIFEPFFTTKPDGQGSGLGLAMVQDFVASSAGRIEVESAPGAGTCVRMSFPAAGAGAGAGRSA